MSERKFVFDLLNREVRPRFRLERMTWSKSIIAGSWGNLVSRSWMNSLKPSETSISLQSPEPHAVKYLGFAATHAYNRHFREGDFAGIPPC